MITPNYILGLREILNRHPSSSHYQKAAEVLNLKVNEVYGTVQKLNEALEAALQTQNSNPSFLKKLRPFHQSLPQELRAFMKKESKHEEPEEIILMINSGSSESASSRARSLNPLPPVKIVPPTPKESPVTESQSDHSSRCSARSVKSLLDEKEPDNLVAYLIKLFETHKKQASKPENQLSEKNLLSLIKHYDKHYQAWKESTSPSYKKQHALQLKNLSQWATEEGYQSLPQTITASIEFIKHNSHDKVALEKALITTPREPISETQSEHGSFEDINDEDLDKTLDLKENLLNWLCIVYERICSSESLSAMSHTVKLIYISRNFTSAEDKVIFMDLLNVFEDVCLGAGTYEINISSKVKNELVNSISEVQTKYQLNDDEGFEMALHALRGSLRKAYTELGILLLNKSSFCENYESDLKLMSVMDAVEYNKYLFMAYPNPEPLNSGQSNRNSGRTVVLLSSVSRRSSGDESRKSITSQQTNVGTDASSSSQSNKTNISESIKSSKSAKSVRSSRSNLDLADSTIDGNNESSRSELRRSLSTN